MKTIITMTQVKRLSMTLKSSKDKKMMKSQLESLKDLVQATFCLVSVKLAQLQKAMEEERIPSHDRIRVANEA